VPFEVDDTIVRGLDYYTRTVFELHCDRLGAQSQIGGGGRYDGLIEQLGGPSTPAMGWALGVERVALALDGSGGGEEPARDGVFIVAGDDERERALSLAVDLRRAGIRADLDLAGRAQKGQMKQADRTGSRYALFLEAQGEGGSANLRDLETGDQRAVDVSRLTEELVDAP
jgi:histidyl-tRNA synthetase